MLEFKNVEIAVDYNPLSFVVMPGEVLAVIDSENDGKCSLVDVALGRRPATKGYVTIEGELVTVGSAPYFRKNIGYVPNDVDFPLHKVGDLVSAMIEISTSRGKECTKAMVNSEMAILGLNKALLEHDVKTMNRVELRLILVAICAAMGGRLLVVDNPVDCVDERFSKVLAIMAQKGWAVVVTERGDYLKCDKKVVLNKKGEHKDD